MTHVVFFQENVKAVFENLIQLDVSIEMKPFWKKLLIRSLCDSFWHSLLRGE